MRKFRLGLAAAVVLTGLSTPAQAAEDTYIVVLREHILTTNVTSQYDVNVRHTYSSALNGFSATMTEQKAAELKKDPNVQLVQRNITHTVSDAQNNPQAWGLDRIDQRTLPFDQTYYYSTDAANVHAYVVDTGIRATHQQFEGRVKEGFDAIDNDTNPDDCHGHGTHVSGTVGGKDFGVAKKVTLHGVRVLNCKGSGTTEQVVAGIDWVTKNAVKPAVANMSLGGEEDDVLDAALKKSVESGITYAVAAGNSNTDACTQSPAREPSAITVGATARDDSRAYFSNYGTCLDIFAPGLGILSSWKDSDTATLDASGTSMASPHVAGAAALYLAKNPAATPQQVRDALVTAATPDKVTNPGPNSPNKLLFTNHGIVPPPPTPGCGRKTNENDVQIPDAGEYVGTAIRYAGCKGNAPKATKVEVTIKHSAQSDVRIELAGPSGRTYLLKANGAGTKFQPYYTVDLSSETKNGTWQLLVRDRSEGDVGTVESWAITLPKK
ncbi:S8 family serine peptidase [Lentzea sp. NPDC051838]|uniref:S8 family peptidase n=1 Tax=Lentzea sp. NPDC051838 TaxID=3154849 RepID=UPI00343696BC